MRDFGGGKYRSVEETIGDGSSNRASRGQRSGIQVLGSPHYARKLRDDALALYVVRRIFEDLIHCTLGTRHEELCLSCHRIEQELSQLFHLGRVEFFHEICPVRPRTGRNRGLVEPGGQMHALFAQELEQRRKVFLESRRLSGWKPDEMTYAKGGKFLVRIPRCDRITIAVCFRLTKSFG
jgi:hypothetical protein